MNAKQRLLLFGCLVAIAAAQRPAGSATSGKVLILDNQRAVEGDITLQGDQYCVRRGKGEMSVPAAKTLRLCASWDDALRFMKSRANLNDPDERLRLARWCEQHSLLESALKEVNAALDMGPGHRGARQLQALLTKALALKDDTRSEGAPRAGVAALPPLDIGSESLALFTNKVNPILMNRCVQCHSQGRGGTFELSRGYEGGLRAATQRNLAAAIAQIDAKEPALSPLLIKAASAHDGGKVEQPPLQGGRQSIPYKTLESWVQMVAANNPHLREGHAPAPLGAEKAASSLPATPEPRRLPVGASDGSDNPTPSVARQVERIASPTPMVMAGATETARVVPINGQKPGPPPAPSPASPPATPVNASPADPFDPAVFNQQFGRD